MSDLPESTLSALVRLLERGESVLRRLEHLLPHEPGTVDWHTVKACRWRRSSSQGALHPVLHPHAMALDNLQHIDAQKQVVVRNTEQFVRGLPANNVLLTGARGTGKSSLIKACFHQFQDQGLRLIEVDKDQLVDLPDIVDSLRAEPWRFIVYCDDLSFSAHEGGYKALKVVLDGSIAGQSDHVLIYASSNRRHLMPERQSDNEGYRHAEDGELHPGEDVEEKISLSERFGLWVSFYPFRQDHYLDIVDAWLRHYLIEPQHHPEVREQALQWALQRGSRSGRVAMQFARDFAGQVRS